jgi:fructose-bisphosphate aldolase class 1
MSEDLASVAVTLVADGKGILAADESVATLTRRLTRSGSSQPKPDPMVTS